MTGRLVCIVLLFTLTSSSFAPNEADISDDIVYSCFNEAVVPYLKSKGDPNIRLGQKAVTTVFASGWAATLYDAALTFLVKELEFDKEKIKFIKREIRREDGDWQWNAKELPGIEVSDTLSYYQGHHFSRPMVSKDHNTFIIIRFWMESQHGGRCGTLATGHEAMVFGKKGEAWELLKLIRDARTTY